jgi:uncharacterized protein (TIGR02466 family)|tara:strand:+ start:76 stop:642 length:567 start_codon:yes stop_codon:yes gene_type:complete
MKEFNLFPTPVMEFDFSSHLDVPKILDIIGEDFQSPPHKLIENGYSSFSFPQKILTSPLLIDLKNDFQKCIDHYSINLDIRESRITDSWFNIIYSKGKVKPHNHGASVISGAFYPLLEKDTCNLCFKSPLYTSLNFRPLKSSRKYFQADHNLPIKQNHLYLFPGWLEHYTEENKGDKRIVISFNTGFY